MEKGQPIQQMVLSQLALSMQRNEYRPFLSPCTKLKCKWIQELYIKPDLLKLLEEKVGKTLKHIGTGENFLNRTPMACALRSDIYKWDLMKLQSFRKAKDTVKKTKGSQQIVK